MVQKAKLDIFDNFPDLEINDAQEKQGETIAEDDPLSNGKWALNKIILIATPSLIVILVITGLLWSYLTKKVEPLPETKLAAPSNVLGKKESSPALVTDESKKINTVYFKDFVIDLKDKSGKSKILMCDVVFDIVEGINVAETDKGKNIRNVIYQTTKGKNAVALKSIEERKRLKNELSTELNKILGDGFVKNVYFINFIIL